MNIVKEELKYVGSIFILRLHWKILCISISYMVIKRILKKKYWKWSVNSLSWWNNKQQIINNFKKRLAKLTSHLYKHWFWTELLATIEDQKSLEWGISNWNMKVSETFSLSNQVLMKWEGQRPRNIIHRWLSRWSTDLC